MKNKAEQTQAATDPIAAKINDHPNQLLAYPGIHLSLLPKHANIMTPKAPQTPAANNKNAVI